MIKELRDLGFKGEIKGNFVTKSKTSYRIGGETPFFICPESLDDLKILSRHYQNKPFPFFILGKGSNILIGDGKLKSIFISLEKMPEVFETSDHDLNVSANIPLQKIIRHARDNGFTGFERLCGIPGNVGGAIRMNAGTHLGEVKDLLTSFTSFDLASGSFNTITKNEFNFSYRHNDSLSGTQIVTAAVFKLIPGNSEKIKPLIDETLKRRKETQPLDKPNCGSVFRNPPGHKAWELIDKAGLRGHQIGSAQISPMHPNWIVNLGEARSQDVRDLIGLVKKTVMEKFQVELVAEVQFVD